MVFLLTTSACFKAVAAFFSTGHSLDTLVAQLVGHCKMIGHFLKQGMDGCIGVWF
jgi:hypothetical protein